MFLPRNPPKSKTMTVHIPAPPSVPFLGNINSLDKELPLRSYNLLASHYGEIYQLHVAGMPVALPVHRHRTNICRQAESLLSSTRMSS